MDISPHVDGFALSSSEHVDTHPFPNVSKNIGGIHSVHKYGLGHFLHLVIFPPVALHNVHVLFDVSVASFQALGS